MGMSITSAGYPVMGSTPRPAGLAFGRSQSTASERVRGAGINRGRPGHAVSRSARRRVETLLYHRSTWPALVPLHTLPHRPQPTQSRQDSQPESLSIYWQYLSSKVVYGPYAQNP